MWYEGLTNHAIGIECERDAGVAEPGRRAAFRTPWVKAHQGSNPCLGTDARPQSALLWGLVFASRDFSQ